MGTTTKLHQPSAPPRGSITLADVADAAGVSKSTVSRVLSQSTGDFSISKPVRDKVSKEAERLGYRPNAVARALISRRTNLIALVDGAAIKPEVPDNDDVAIRHLAYKLSQDNLQLTAAFGEPHGRFQLPAHRVDGLVVVRATSVNEFEEIERSTLPYVSINGVAGPTGSAVMINEQIGMQLAVHHLFELGHTRINYLTLASPFAGHYSHLARRSGYLAEMHRHGLEPMPGFDVECELAAPSPEPVVDWAKRFVQDAGATAVICHNHVLGVLALRAVQRLGLAVPEQVSILCFNDMFPAEHLFPSMTVVRSEPVHLGEVAHGLLMDRIEGGTPRVVHVTPDLVARESTAPPPAA